MGYIVDSYRAKLAKNKGFFKMSKVIIFLKTVFKGLCDIFKPDSLEELEKDKEIEYERNQWGYWK